MAEHVEISYEVNLKKEVLYFKYLSDNCVLWMKFCSIKNFNIVIKNKYTKTEFMKGFVNLNVIIVLQ